MDETRETGSVLNKLKFSKMKAKRLRIANEINFWYELKLEIKRKVKMHVIHMGTVQECQENIVRLLKEGEFKNVSQAIKFRRENKNNK